MASSFVGLPLSGMVLIADDDADFRRLLVRRATRMGLTVVEASSGTQALEAVRKTSFDAIVVDVYMPGCSGVEVAQEARNLDAHVQAIVLTGSATLENAIEALRAGVYDFLTKPLESLDVFETTGASWTKCWRSRLSARGGMDVPFRSSCSTWTG
jgi:DNA-binding NtrC family response regulator